LTSEEAGGGGGRRRGRRRRGRRRRRGKRQWPRETGLVQSTTLLTKPETSVA